MRCYNCGKKMKSRKGRYHFVESGLPNVYLDEVVIHYCSCGEEAAEIPCLDDLLDKIAKRIVASAQFLSGAEVRFLRKRLGLQANELAEILGVSRVTVSRWENDKVKIDKAYDDMIRALIKSRDFREVLEELHENKRTKRSRSHKYVLNAGDLLDCAS